MKFFIFLFALISLLSCLSDTPQICSNVNIFNNTKYEITLEAFKNKTLLKSINIAPLGRNENFVNTKSVDTFFGLNSLDIDSTNIKFSNEKIIVEYCFGKTISFCNTDEKSLYSVYSRQNIGGGTRFSLNSEKCKILKDPIEITFNQSDYDRAVPIKK